MFDDTAEQREEDVENRDSSIESVFKEWTCIFPGKMGISWKRAWDEVGTKSEAEAEAAKNCSVIAVPLQLFTHIKEYEHRMVAAENELTRLKTRLKTEKSNDEKDSKENSKEMRLDYDSLLAIIASQFYASGKAQTVSEALSDARGILSELSL